VTTVELERIARTILPQVGATGWRITERGSAADGATIYAVVPIIGGRLDGRDVFRGSQRDCHRMYDILEGRAPTSRRAQNATLGTTAPTDASSGLTEAPQPLTSADSTGIGSRPRADASGERIPGGASLRLCEGCDQPLPEDARANQRTHDGACRIAAFRRRAATKATGADADSAEADVTDSDPVADGQAPASLAGHDLASSIPVDVKQGRAQPEAPDRSAGALALTPTAAAGRSPQPNDDLRASAAMSGNHTAAIPARALEDERPSGLGGAAQRSLFPAAAP
jgi:hypothetical protein